ncbi:MAG TPA: LysM domain-containing protein [Solirubrobacteraceae bacterium]|nr:LysM domain-containing protein [Solirubrobacteraceae bacterium]
MAEVDLERLVLPALLALLLLGALVILVTSGGDGGEPVSPAAPPAATSRPASETTTSTVRFVKVRAGDTPTSIAKSAGMSVEQLLDLNPSVDPARLRPGQTLKLAR